jgi:Zn-dependent M16 (insulinase) family peptidase
MPPYPSSPFLSFLQRQQRQQQQQRWQQTIINHPRYSFLSSTSPTTNYYSLQNNKKWFSTTTTNRGQNRPSLTQLGLSINNNYHNFTLTNISYIEEFKFNVLKFEHAQTGAILIHVDCDDTNNAFAVGFKTPPPDNTGLPHILEHVVLCGSQHFPVRDPFFKMLKRSLNTFMNAMTASDFTVYPFSTQNIQDYKNLMQVYTDATFFPLLRESDFKQEGHRLELVPDTNNNNNNQHRLIRSGVVYNEMKGALSDSSSLFSTRLSQAIFGPDSPYGRVSGGDPLAIPQLTHENLVAFHHLHYHPSNSLFTTYGDMNIVETLQYLNEHVLNQFSFSQASHKIGHISITHDNDNNNKPISVTIPLPPDGEKDDKAKYAKSWKLPQISSTDQHACLVARILSGLVMGGPQAPLHAAIIDSSLAPDFAPGSGFDSSSLIPTFTLGVQGVKESDFPLINETISTTLEKTIREGFPPDRVRAIQHQIELSIRHQRANFGLHVIQSATSAWAHGVPPETSLSIASSLQRLKKEGSDPEYWKQLTKEWIMDGWNSPHVIAIGTVQESFARDATEAETQTLAKEYEKLGKEGLEQIQQANILLKQEREMVEDVNILPTLSIQKDVPRDAPQVIRTIWQNNNNNICRVETNTNGVGYFRFWIPSVVEDQDQNGQAIFNVNKKLGDDGSLLLLPMLCYFLSQIDVVAAGSDGPLDFKQLALKLEMLIGSLSISPRIVNVVKKSENGTSFLSREAGILVTCDSLFENSRDALSLVQDILLQSDFTSSSTTQRVQSLLSSYGQGVIASLPHDAMGYAKSWALAPYDGFALQERWGGFSRVAMAQVLLEKCVHDSTGAQVLCDGLNVLKNRILGNDQHHHHHRRPRSSFVGDDTNTKQLFESVFMKAHQDLLGKRNVTRNADLIPQFTMWSTLLNKQDQDAILFEPHSRATFVALSGVGVHYCVGTLKTPVIYGHEDDAAMLLLMHILKHDFLHREVRESGGAYGSGASISMDGIVMLTSYWDPNALQTLETFDKGLTWLCTDNTFDQRAVEEALLVAFSDLDAPISPSQQGMGEFLHNITNIDREKRRARLFELIPGRRDGSSSSSQQVIEKLKTIARKYFQQENRQKFVDVGKQQYSTALVNQTVVVAGKAETWEKEGFNGKEGWVMKQV